MASVVQVWMEVCTCGNHLGRIQRRIENQIRAGVNLQTQLRQLGWMRMCCRRSVLTAPMYFLRDVTSNAFLDNSVQRGTDQKMQEDEPAVVPKRPLPSYPVIPGLVEVAPPPKPVPPPTPVVAPPPAIPVIRLGAFGRPPAKTAPRPILGLGSLPFPT